MPSGDHLSRDHLELIWYQRRILEKNANTVWLDVFQEDANRISLKYLSSLCKRCNSGLYDAQFNGPRVKRSGGQKFTVEPDGVQYLLNIWYQRRQTRQWRAREDLSVNYYGELYGGPSLSTISRVLSRSEMTRKVLQRVHYLRSPVLRAQFMDDIGHVDYFRIVDVDETLSTWKEFLQRYGYAPKGEVAVRTQFQINGQHYSSVCAYSAMGLIAYRVVRGSINAETFKSFLETELHDALLPGMFGLFDNAAIHHTQPVREIMQDIFGGDYIFSAPYSPDLKPVERLFAVVKNLLRDREDEAVVNPMGVISECFEMFRPGGPKSHMAANHFRLYRDNHNMWRERMGL
jgi:transposase